MLYSRFYIKVYNYAKRNGKINFLCNTYFLKPLHIENYFCGKTQQHQTISKFSKILYVFSDIEKVTLTQTNSRTRLIDAVKIRKYEQIMYPIDANQNAALRMLKLIRSNKTRRH